VEQLHKISNAKQTDVLLIEHLLFLNYLVLVRISLHLESHVKYQAKTRCAEIQEIDRAFQ